MDFALSIEDRWSTIAARSLAVVIGTVIASSSFAQLADLPRESSSTTADKGLIEHNSESVKKFRLSLTEGSLDDRRLAAVESLRLPGDAQLHLLRDIIALLHDEKDGQIRLALFDTVTKMGPLAKDAVPVLLKAVRQDFGGRHNEEVHQNYRAALSLASIGEPAVEGLRGLLAEDAEGFRAEAAMALGRIGPKASPAIPALVSMLNDDSKRVRRDVVWALGRIGDAAGDSLFEAAQSDDAIVRTGALEALGHAAPQSQRVANLVKQRLRDGSGNVRLAAAKLLTVVSLTDTEMEDSLLSSLADTDSSVSAIAVDGLLARPDVLSNARSGISRLLVGEDDDVAWHAAFVLYHLGADAVPLFLNAATDKAGRLDQLAEALSLIDASLEPILFAVLDEGDYRSQEVAALALGKIRPLKQETVRRLAAGLEQDDKEAQAVFLRAIESLGSRAQEALPATRALIGHKDTSIRLKTMSILSQAAAKDDQLVRDLSGFVQDSEPEIQRAAIDHLRALGPLARDSISIVLDSLDRESRDVRHAALKFLGSHGLGATSCVPRLLQELAGSEDIAWKVAVMETLSEIGEGARAAYEDLRKMLGDDEAELRLAALKTLSRLRIETQILGPHLLHALRDSDANVQAQAGSSIRRLGARGTILIPDLIMLMDDDAVKEIILPLLERMERYQPDSSTIASLLELAADKKVTVQLHAIRFLGLAGPEAEDAVDYLRELLEHENEKLRAAAAEAIEKIGTTDES